MRMNNIASITLFLFERVATLYTNQYQSYLNNIREIYGQGSTIFNLIFAQKCSSLFLVFEENSLQRNRNLHGYVERERV